MGTIVRNEDKSNISYGMTAFAGVIAYRVCPEKNCALDPLVSKLFDTVVALDKRAAEINASTELSSVGKEAAIKTQETYKDAVFNALEKVRQWHKNWSTGLEVAQLAMYAPEPLEKGDVVGAIKDQEIRAWWRTFEAGPVKEKFVAEASAGQHAEVVQALCRCPIPDEVQRFGRLLFKTAKEKTDGPLLRELEIRQESIDWCRLAANTCVQPVMRIFTTPDKRLIPIGKEAGPSSTLIRQVEPAQAA